MMAEKSGRAQMSQEVQEFTRAAQRVDEEEQGDEEEEDESWRDLCC